MIKVAMIKVAMKGEGKPTLTLTLALTLSIMPKREFDNLAEHVRQHLRYVGSRLCL